MRGNGSDPIGYRAPVHLALTKLLSIGGVPRELLGIWAVFCVGAAMAFKTWGAIPLYVIGHAVMAYLTWRDPHWIYVLQESLRYRWQMWMRRF